MVPAVGNSSPAIMRSVVVLPQPEGPSRQRNSPSSTVKLASLDGMEIPEGFVERFDPDLCHPPYSLTFETMMNITVPNSVVANDQE